MQARSGHAPAGATSQPPYLTLQTKLVATIGPASQDPDTLDALLEAGVDVCRINFSHGELSDHARVVAHVRAWSARHDRAVAILGDLCGPKIRLLRVQGGRIELVTGQTVRFVRGTEAATPQQLTTTFTQFVDEVDVGQRIYIDDGLVRLLVVDRTPDELVCTCTHGGTVSDRKGINLPDTRLSVPALTDKDRRDLAWALEQGLDYVGLSFARQASDVLELRKLLEGAAPRPGVLVKIEMVEALEHLDAIIELADAVMVARGDLGVQMDVWQVPLVQKALTARCRQAGKPIIIATQMLQSMVNSPSPTRAEVSDVANAILDSADAVMLSAETAAGHYPLQAVEMMGRIAQATEAYLLRSGPAESAPPGESPGNPRAAAIASAAVRAALRLDVHLLAVWTATGETVRLVAQHRPPMPVVGLTYDEAVWRKLSLVWGVIPIRVRPLDHPAEMGAALDERLLARGLARVGDLVVVVTSTRPTQPGETDTTLIHRVGRP
jgi:pyruvate kinase